MEREIEREEKKGRLVGMQREGETRTETGSGIETKKHERRK